MRISSRRRLFRVFLRLRLRSRSRRAFPDGRRDGWKLGAVAGFPPRQVGLERGAPHEAELGHQLVVLARLVVRRGQKRVTREHRVRARQEAHRLVRRAHVDAARAEAHHGFGHHQSRHRDGTHHL